MNKGGRTQGDYEKFVPSNLEGITRRRRRRENYEFLSQVLGEGGGGGAQEDLQES